MENLAKLQHKHECINIFTVSHNDHYHQRQLQSTRKTDAQAVLGPCHGAEPGAVAPGVPEISWQPTSAGR